MGGRGSDREQVEAPGVWSLRGVWGLATVTQRRVADHTRLVALHAAQRRIAAAHSNNVKQFSHTSAMTIIIVKIIIIICNLQYASAPATRIPIFIS
jgi:hypothetical protein